MLYMQANESLARVYIKVIKASGQQIKWKGIFLIRYNTVVLIGDVRSLYLDLDKRTVKTGAEDFLVKDLVPVGDNKLLTNLLNMLLYAFGKWESVKGLKVEQDYNTLTALFKGILQEIDTVPYFTDKGYKFSHNQLQVTFEEVMQLAVDKRRREEEQKISEDADENMGLWHSMKWKVQNIEFEREDIGEEDVKSRRLGHNFYMTPYKCPDCGMHLHMAVYPEGDEFKIETEEGKVFLARVYSCPNCNVFYTPRPEKLLRECDIYVLGLEDDDQATKDYRKLLGEKAVRTANGNFNLFETDYYRKGKRHNRTLPQICRDLNKLTQEDIEEILEKMQEGFFSERDRDRFKAIIEQELFYRESVAARQRGEFGTPRDYKDDDGEEEAGQEDKRNLETAQGGIERNEISEDRGAGVNDKQSDNSSETGENDAVSSALNALSSAASGQYEETNLPDAENNGGSSGDSELHENKKENINTGKRSGFLGHVRGSKKNAAKNVSGGGKSFGAARRSVSAEKSDEVLDEISAEDRIEKLLRDLIEEVKLESDEDRIAELLGGIATELGGEMDENETAEFVHSVMGMGGDVSVQDRIEELLRDIMGDADSQSERDIISELLQSVMDEVNAEMEEENKNTSGKDKIKGRSKQNEKNITKDNSGDKTLGKTKDKTSDKSNKKAKDKYDDKSFETLHKKVKEKSEDKTFSKSKEKAKENPEDKLFDKPKEKTKENPEDKLFDKAKEKTKDKSFDLYKRNGRISSNGTTVSKPEGETVSTHHGDVNLKSGNWKKEDEQGGTPPSPEELKRKKHDEERMAEICPDPAEVDFADGLAALKAIQEEDLLPEIKSGMIDQLEKRLTRLKADESEQLVEKLKKDMQGKVSDYSRIYFYNARKMLRGNNTDKASSLIRTAISTYAYSLAEYEYPVMISDSSIFKGGKEGFILTPDHIFYKGLIRSGIIDINRIKSVDVNAAIRGKGIILHHETEGRLKLPCTLSGGDLSGMTEVLDGFIEYLQEKPESRSVSYLSRKDHAVKCCYRCGHTFKEGNICPNCGSKVLS